MKKIISTSLVACSVILTANAYGADGLYVSADVGLAMLNDADATDRSLPGIEASMEYDAGVAVIAALGYRMQQFRFEGEIGYQVNDFDQQSGFGQNLDLEGDQTALSFLANVYYDIPTNSRFTPFMVMIPRMPIRKSAALPLPATASLERPYAASRSLLPQASHYSSSSAKTFARQVTTTAS